MSVLRSVFRFVLLLSFFCLFFPTPAVAFSTPFIRAVFPNPVGSDSLEWIVVENASASAIPAGAITIADTEGAVHEYKVPEIFLGEYLFLQATVSGIALNNAADSVVILEGDQLIDSTEVYDSAEEGLVWWRSDTDVWQWEAVSDFLVRLAARNFGKVATGEDSESDVLTETESDVSLEESWKETETAKPSEIPIPLVYSARAPRLLARVDNAVSPPKLTDIPYPEIDFDQEKADFVWWKRQALKGSLGVFFGGSCWVILAFPRWWQWYRWRM